MSLPSDEAGLRALDAKCASRASSDYKRTVAQLSVQSLEIKEMYLVSSAYWDLPNLVRTTLDAGCPPDTLSEHPTEHGLNMIPVAVMAAHRGFSRVLKALLDGGADHRVTDSRGFTALSAAAHGHEDCLKVLLAAGADPNAVDWLGNHALLEAVMNRHTECVKVLLPVSDLTVTNRRGRSVLHTCVTSSSQECLDLLLPLVSDVDARTLPGLETKGDAVFIHHCTPLHLACQVGQQPMLSALLKRGAARMARDCKGQLPLHCAAASGHLACVIALIGRPGKVKMTPEEVNTAEAKGITPLHFAAIQGHEKICGVLLQAGARLVAKTASGRTPLMLAQHYHPANAALLALLSGGASPAQLPGTVCDHCGKTAEQAAVSHLRSCGACFEMRYCGAACSAAAWPAHKAACKERRAEREKRTEARLVISPSATPS